MLPNLIKHISKYFLLPALLVLFVASSNMAVIHKLTDHQESKIIADFTKETSDCSVCFLSDSQNQLSFSNLLLFSFAAFTLAFISRVFNKVKLSYLLSSYCSRAPPFSS